MLNMIKVVIPVSGGKDSQACLKLALCEYMPANVIGLFCDTQYEHPTTYEHINWMSKFYKVYIHKISTGSVIERLEKYKRFPTSNVRFCTSDLKIRPSIKFYFELFKSQGPFEVWYGMRCNESLARKEKYSAIIDRELYEPHELLNSFPKYLGRCGIRFKLPIVNWSTDTVLRFLDGKENPLYKDFSRVGCFPCLASGDTNKLKAFSYDELGQERYKIINKLELEFNRSIWKNEKYRQIMQQNCDTKNQLDNEPFEGCAFCAI